MNLIKEIEKVLKRDGTEVYMPGQKKGECINEYIVVKKSGAMQEYIVSSERPMYDIMCYVPGNNYSRLESFVFETKQKLKELFPIISYAGNETESYYDESVKAHMISFMYQGIRKIENW